MFQLSRIYFGFCNDNVYDIKNVSHKRPFSGHSHKRPIMPFGNILCIVKEGLANLCKPLYINALECGASRNRTTDTWIFSTMLCPIYQSLTATSDPTVTIFCPGLSRNADSSSVKVQRC